MTGQVDTAWWAQFFHETYERLAPEFGYKTREASAVPWEDVPENNKALMMATAGVVIAAARADGGAALQALVAKWEREGAEMIAHAKQVSESVYGSALQDVARQARVALDAHHD